MCEHFYAVLLDNKHHKIRDVIVSKGALTASNVHPGLCAATHKRRCCCFLQGSPKSASIRGWMSLLSTRESPLTSSRPQGARPPLTTLRMSAGRSAAVTRPSQLASPRTGDAVGLGVGLDVGEGVGDALGDGAAVSVRVGVPLVAVVGGVAGVLTVLLALGVGVLDGVGVTVGRTVAVVDGVAVGAAAAAGAQKPPFNT